MSKDNIRMTRIGARVEILIYECDFLFLCGSEEFFLFFAGLFRVFGLRFGLFPGRGAVDLVLARVFRLFTARVVVFI